MESNKAADKNIQFLINANYQRMMSFEQAAFLTSEETFKNFYLQKAEESEQNIQQLYQLLNMEYTGDGIGEVVAGNTTDAYLPSVLNGKKSNSKILASLKVIEKTIGNWYKNTLKEISGLPKGTIELLKEQYRSLGNAQLQLEHL